MAGMESGSMATKIENPNRVSGTLDEPVSVTLKRDLDKIWVKIKYVVNPTGEQEDTVRELRNWDLWGPLLLCLQLSIMLSLSAPPTQEMVIFAR